MQEDLKTLAEQITALSNNFVAEAVRCARYGKSPAFISLPQVAPEGFPKELIERYIHIIQAELKLRPEIKRAHVPQTIEDFSERKAFDPLVLVTEIQPEYLRGKEPEKRISLSRLAEVGEQAVEYVREEAEDVVQDLTERLGLSMEEVALLDPSYCFLEASVSERPAVSALSDRILNAKHRSAPHLSDGADHSAPAFE